MLRFFAKKNRGLLSTPVVSVYVKTSLGLVVPVPVGVLLGNGQRKAIAPDADRRQPAPAASGRSSRPKLPFQFTPLLGDWQIGIHVYVDPMRIR